MAHHLPRHTTLLSLVLAAGLLWPVPLAVAPVAPQSIAPTDACFVRGIYRDVLWRVPDGLEVSNGLTFLGSHTNAEYATTLVTSDEYRTLLIKDWYQTFLGRAATAGEITAGITIFDSAGKDEDIIAIIVGSDEYFILARVGGDNANFIKAIYRDLLGRPAQPADIGFGLGYLGGHTRQQFAALILSSAEYQVVIIQAWYHRFLGRSATNGEVSAARGILIGGGADEDVIAIVVGSDEYFARAGLCTTYLPLVKR